MVATGIQLAEGQLPFQGVAMLLPDAGGTSPCFSVGSTLVFDAIFTTTARTAVVTTTLTNRSPTIAGQHHIRTLCIADW